MISVPVCLFYGLIVLVIGNLDLSKHSTTPLRNANALAHGEFFSIFRLIENQAKEIS